jgi:hypothetical protein
MAKHTDLSAKPNRKSSVTKNGWMVKPTFQRQSKQRDRSNQEHSVGYWGYLAKQNAETSSLVTHHFISSISSISSSYYTARLHISLLGLHNFCHHVHAHRSGSSSARSGCSGKCSLNCINRLRQCVTKIAIARECQTSYPSLPKSNMAIRRNLGSGLSSDGGA